MRLSKSFIPTLREDPAEAEIISHKLMVRSGMLRKAAAGVYTWMPLGLRVLRKVEQIVREEMDGIGCQEVMMSVLQPAEIWKMSGRWKAYGDEMMRLSDRHDRDFCLGPTHEEMITTIAKELRSYKDLPACLYQIQVKFRDEIRPRFGVMRSREFLMKDAYSFHPDQNSLAETYSRMSRAYSRIIERCGLEFRSVKAAAGLIGGAVSEEFMVLAEAGEDVVVYCSSCSYAANLETATSKWHTPGADEPLEKPEKIHTPNRRSVEQVASVLEVPAGKLVKTLILKAGERTVAALVPGNKELNPAKLAGALGVAEVRLFSEEDFAAGPELVSGYVGPVGLDGVYLVADHSIKRMRNFVTGANERDFHFKNINVDQDFAVDLWADLVFAEVGETCPECGEGRLEQIRGIEAGHIFQLGTKYSDLLDANFVDENGDERPFVMGCYGVGVSRLVAAAIEQKNDDSGIIWPASIAPYQLHLLALGKDDAIKCESDKLYERLSASFEVLYDDRTVSAGVKFADADLLGIPVQLIAGKKMIETNEIEIKVRDGGDRRQAPVDEIEAVVAGLLRESA